MIHLITGGTRSGKSSYAEGLLKESKSILYIATSMVTDDEMKERVRQHQSRRGARYKTYEGHKKLSKVIENSVEETVLLECIGTMITNMIFDRYMDVEGLTTDEIKELEKDILIEVNRIIQATKDKEVYIITNEVGLGLISEYKLGRVFTDILGRANQMIAGEADWVTFMVSGLPMKVK